MKKRAKSLVCLVALSMGLTMLTGCGKVKPDELVEKYAGYCELGEYKGIEYQETKTTITDEMIQSEINGILESYGTTEAVTSGTAAYGDTVNIDYKGTIDDVAFDGGTAQGTDLQLGSGRMIDGFEDQIVGHDVGETFDIYVTFPENYGAADLAGKDAVFEIKINTLTKLVLPEYNDEFVAANTDFATVEEFEAALREEYETWATDNDESYNRAAVIKAIMEQSTINEYPEKEMQKLIDETIKEVEAEASSYGYDLGTYVAARYGMASEDVFRDYVAGLAEDFIKEKIIICAIADAEGITVSKDEIKSFRKEMMENLDCSEEELDKEYTEEDIMYYAIADKVYDFLLENGVAVEATSTDAE